MTFAAFSYAGVLDALSLPPTELAWFQGIPFLDASPAVLIALPLLALLLLILAAPPFFRGQASIVGRKKRAPMRIKLRTGIAVMRARPRIIPRAI